VSDLISVPADFLGPQEGNVANEIWKKKKKNNLTTVNVSVACDIM
jgi:hypothetical protein